MDNSNSFSDYRSSQLTMLQLYRGSRDLSLCSTGQNNIECLCERSEAISSDALSSKQYAKNQFSPALKHD
jgi:hypothetical protein